MIDPPIESIGSVEGTLHLNYEVPGEPYVPWTREQVINYLKQAGVEVDSYVNCRNLALMIRKNQSSDHVLWEGDVNFEDVAK